MAGSEENRSKGWNNGYSFGLLFFSLLGFCLIVIGATLFPSGSPASVTLVGVGVSMAPAAVVALLFRSFLLQDILRE